MHRGYLRLGVVLTCLWLLAIVALVIYGYASRNVFCQFDSSTIGDAVCQHVLWSWVPVGKVAVFSLNLPRLLVAALGFPLAGWLLGFSIAWVAKGFRPSAT